MASLQLDVCLLSPTEPAAQQAIDATRLLSSGDRDGADRLYRSAAALPAGQVSGWNNLAALGIALGDFQTAYTHAYRAVEMDRAIAAAWVTLGVASWHVGKRRDAAQCSHRALELSPGLEAAALNYARMLQVVNRPQQAQKMLSLAVLANPDAWRLHQALAESARLTGDATTAREHALRALDRLRPTINPAQAEMRPVEPGKDADDTAAAARVRDVLFATHDALGAAGLPFHLIGGTLLAIHRDGRPFPHDKDIDLALPFDCDRDAVAAALAGHFKPVLRPDNPNALAAHRDVMGFIHRDTGLGADLMFLREQDGMAIFSNGWPDQLGCRMPIYPLQSLQWAGREWQVPAPPEDYLAAVYGPGWQQPQRYFDTQVSNPSRTPDSLPRAVTLGLLRLLHALQAGQWDKARALCMQLLAREPLAEVQAMLVRLQQAGAA